MKPNRNLSARSDQWLREPRDRGVTDVTKRLGRQHIGDTIGAGACCLRLQNGGLRKGGIEMMMTGAISAFGMNAAIALTVLLCVEQPSRADVPESMNFEAVVKDSTGLVNGSYDITFEIWDAQTGGSSQWGPQTHSTVQIVDGLVIRTLGKSPQHPSDSIGHAEFSGADRWLEVTLTGSSAGTTTTFPRIKLATNPYSYRIATVDGAKGGSIEGTIKVSSESAMGGVLLDPNYPGSGGGAVVLSNGSGSPTFFASADDTGSGNAWLALSGGSDPGSIRMYGATGAGGGAVVYLENGSGRDTVVIDADKGDSGALFTLSDGIRETVELDGKSTDGGSALRMYNGAHVQTVHVDANDVGGGALLSLSSETHETVRLDAQATGGGKLTLSNSGSQETIRLNADSGDAALVTLSRGDAIDNRVTLRLDAANSAGNAYLRIMNDSVDSPTSAELRTKTGGSGVLELYQGTDGDVGVLLEGAGSSTGAGEIRVRDTSGKTAIYMLGESNGGGRISLWDRSDIRSKPAVSMGNDANGAGIINFWKPTTDINENSTVWITAGDQGGGRVLLRNASGARTIQLIGGYDGTEYGRIITSVLQITGGADLSEQFDVESVGEDVIPGTVVSLNPDLPGSLKTSSGPYDRTVAGIVSGAGGVNPGTVMAHDNTLADGKHPVALSGRVYCRADTTNGPIRVGDLLTTSATPGHAMRATDYTRAHGATIGKAMTPLHKGTGLILVLVSLQ